MSSIKVLSEQLRNQIAAGEVVERPASVVKELVENSIDAGVSRVLVEIEGGGEDLIKVTDDGFGMDQEDARLALERHATSKISSEADLHRIGTMGFRGEALASIASVSRFVMRTKKRGEIEGTQVICNGGVMENIEPIGCPEGTQIEVKNLFYNTPARKKYLKTKGTEYQQILGIVTNLALAHPWISFGLRKDGVEVFDVPSSKELKDRARALLGRSVADELIPVFYGGSDIQITGFVGSPSVARSSRRAQYLFVNNRAIQNPSLSYMVRDAYGTLLMDGKQPLFVVMITVNPKLIDVNVHPRKTEVRFVDQQEVSRVLRRACKAALEEIRGGMTDHRVTAFGKHGVWTQNVDSVENSAVAVKANYDVFGGEYVGRQAFGFKESIGIVQEALDFSREILAGKSDNQTVGGRLQALECEESGTGRMGIMGESGGVHGREAGGLGSTPLSMRPLVQVERSYIVAQNDDGLVLIDQHAAHERVLFEKFKRAWEEKTLNKQPLLVPINIELSHQEVAVFEENKEVFEKLGFEIESFGGNTFAVSVVPADMARVNLEKLLIGILDDLINERRLKSAEDRKIKVLEYMACRTAIKFGDALTMIEMEGLIREMDHTDGIATCPHGRPTMIPLSFSELDSKFGRRG